MDPQELTHKWLALSAEGVFDRSDPFLRFVTAWIAFNSLYSEIFPDVEGDKRQVQSFAADARAQAAHELLMERALWYKDAIALLKAGGVCSVRTGQHHNIAFVGNLAQVMDCVYQVRCNLFHGGKHPMNLRDRALARAAYIVTANLVNTYSTGRLLPPETAVLPDNEAGGEIA